MKVNKRRLRLPGAPLATLLLVLVVSACGGSSTGDNGGGAQAAGQNGSSGQIDACSVVTQQDATQLFGKPASPQQGQLNVDPNMLGECLWTWDTETSNQLLQFRIWNGSQYYGNPPANSQPLDIGDKGYIQLNEFAGVSIEWVQGDKTITLDYSTIGSDVPKATTKADAVKNLAQNVSKQM